MQAKKLKQSDTKTWALVDPKTGYPLPGIMTKKQAHRKSARTGYRVVKL